jgi:acyl-CoA thioesterase II
MTDTPRRTLASLLALLPGGEDRWTVPAPGSGPQRLFGGQVAAQSLAAACATVPGDRSPHSLHGYFVRQGWPDSPLELVVERTFDGRSVATRSVRASQQGNTIFSLTVSFHAPEPGFEWQESTLDFSAIPGPDEPVPSTGDASDPWLRPFWLESPFEVRPVPRPDGSFAAHPCWVRLVEPVPEMPSFQQCALTYVSDMGVVSSARAPGSPSEGVRLASIDHAVWFHRPFDLSAWHLFSVRPVSNAGSRGLALGTFHRFDGELVASMAQEALIRVSPAAG